MSPWPPKMATRQILRGVWEGLTLPCLHGWQGHPSLLHHPRAPKNQTKYPLQPIALKLRLLDLKLLNLQLLDLQLMEFQLLDLQLMDFVPYKSANTCRPSKIGTVTGEGQASTNPATAPSMPRVSEQEFKCKHCEHSFYNNKSLKIHNGKTSKSLISPRK